MSFNCILCAAATHQSLPTKDAKTGKELPISLCSACGLVQQTNIPSEEELKAYYTHNYRTDYKNTYIPKLKHVRRAGMAAMDRLRFLKEIIHKDRPMRLLDIGAGGGEFVYLSSQAGLHSMGVEPNQGYSEFSKQEYGIDVKTMALGDLADASADIVTLFHVFEHMANPHAVVAKLYKILNTDGHLFIEVPNILQKDAAPSNIYFKAHLFYYCRQTLQAAASRYFELVKVEDSSNLKMIFKKRAVPLEDLSLPLLEEVGQIKQAVESKGWMTYLFEGRGLIKPLKKLKQLVIESRLRNTSPKSLLDSLAHQRGNSQLAKILSTSVAIFLPFMELGFE